MEETRFERRLAAILAADMVGYSRLMELDETGTITRQRQHRAELIDPTIEKHRGRIAKVMGDGILVEFASAVDAVACAVAIQRAMRTQEAEVAEDRRIQYRIGVNVGDIIIDGDDILGDGVNIAARLEGLADRGGIAISGTAYDQLKARIDIGYEFLGEQAVKNISEPVRIYRALLEGAASKEALNFAAPKKSRRRLIATVTAAIALLAAASAWWFGARPDFQPVNAAELALPLPTRPSITVLPFTNLSEVSERDFVAEGFAETIIDTIARSPELFVIANDASRKYKDKDQTPQEIAREQGVQYVLRGSVQEMGGRVRVTAQLIDALGGYLLWSKRFDRALADLFDIQDEIGLNIAQSLDVELFSTTDHYRFNSIEAWSFHVRSRAAKRAFSREAVAEALRLAKEGLAIEPDASPLWVQVGWAHLDQYLRRTSNDPAQSFELASKAAAEAIRLTPNSAGANALLAGLHSAKRNYEAALMSAEAALRLGPNDASTLGGIVNVFFLGGRHQEVVDLEARVMRLNPFYPHWHQMFHARSLVFLGRHDDALAAVEDGLKRANNYHARSAHLVSRAFAYADKGDLENARAAMEEARREKPFVSAALFRPYWAFKEAADDKRFYGGLKAAGLPESAPSNR